MSKFELGRVVVTREISEKMESDASFAAFLSKSMKRYMKCDWGDLPSKDKRANNNALKTGEERIMASYFYPETGENIWIITEWNRSATTILFPDEY